MKKIFAIALALVMVLSMASAFAANSCSTFSWTCPTAATKCGKGTVEVVPYVIVNTACGWDYEVSTCATAINTQKVYYAVKLTVEANPDMNWWDKATVTIKETEVESPLKGAVIGDLDVLAAGSDDYPNTETQVYYLLGLNGTTATWINAADETFSAKRVVWEADVANAHKAKVCATLKSEHNGLGTWTVGDYEVTVEATGTDYKEGMITIEKEGRTCYNRFEMGWFGGKVDFVYADSDAFFAEVVAKFNMNGCVVGTCVDKDILKANFGWKDKVESCFSWSDKGASVVNPECVVTLPKTGDASLLWWLF